MHDWEFADYLSRFVIVALGVGAVVFLVWYRRTDFVVKMRDGQVRWKGRIPQSQAQALGQFLRDEFPDRRKVKVTGAWRGKRLQLWFHGDLTRSEKQRVRNFLMTRIAFAY